MPTLLEIEGDDWRIEIVGSLPSFPTFLEIKPSTTIRAVGVKSMTRFVSTSRRLETVQPGEFIEPLFYEAVGYDLHLERSDSRTTLTLPPGADKRRVREHSEHHFINFGNNVGYTDLVVDSPSGRTHIQLEVFSRKVDYRTDYATMRAEVSAILRNLALSTHTKTYALAAPHSASNPTLIEWFALVKSHFDAFLKLSMAIAYNPHARLTKRSQARDTQRAKRVTRQTISSVMRRPQNGPIHPALGTPLPRRIQQTEFVSTFDTQENRYIKSLIKETLRKVRELLRTGASGDEDAEPDADTRFFKAIRDELGAMQGSLERLLQAPFFLLVSDSRTIRPNSMVFHSHPLYARLDGLCRLLNGGLSFTGNIVPIGVKDTSLLYEYWCFLKIVSILHERFDLQAQTIVKFQRMRSVVTLQKGKRSAIRFLDKRSGRSLDLVYNRLFNRLPTLAQKPDNVIQFSSEDRFYIFDAKYRIQFDERYLEKYQSAGPTEEDINTMHRYRDAIAIPHPITQKYQRGVVIGAAVLFPHPKESEYSGHRFHKSLNKVEIGGLPFLPGATTLLEKKIDALLSAELFEVPENST